jgi:hypothetical protein
MVMSAARIASQPSASPGQAGHRWLVFAHQLPTHPSNARVKTWRRLRQIGAVAVKNSVYVLPNTAQASEDFEWLRTEVAGLDGQATVFEASSVNGVEDQHIVELFRTARAEDYGRLTAELRGLRTTLCRSGKSDEEAARAVSVLRERYRQLQAIDFFSAPGRAEADAALIKLDAEWRPSPPPRAGHRKAKHSVRDFQNRQWVTRPRPGVDRFASAWLIRRFIDARASFVFAASPDKRPEAVPFDMYQTGGFRHEGDQCTFEVLEDRFGIKDAAVRRIGEVVHDLDLRDDRFKSTHAPTVGLLVEGLRASIADDAKLLEQGMALFEALYQSLRAGKPPRGQPKIC